MTRTLIVPITGVIGGAKEYPADEATELDSDGSAVTTGSVLKAEVPGLRMMEFETTAKQIKASTRCRIVLTKSSRPRVAPVFQAKSS